jgi:nitrate reductase alpha subunit
MQALDYPLLEAGAAALRAARLPARHLVLLVPLQPAAREVPLHPRRAARRLWRERARQDDPVDAWENLVSDPEKRAALPAGARQGRLPPHLLGHGARDHRAANITRQEVRPRPHLRLLADPGDVDDQLRGRRALPAAHRRRQPELLRLVLRPAPPRPRSGASRPTWRVADWYNAKFIAVMGANLNMTRTPDCHFAAEARHNGTKMSGLLARLQPGLQVRRRVGPDPRRQDGAWWMAVNHVMLKEFHHDKPRPLLPRLHASKYTDAPVPGRSSRSGEGGCGPAACCAPTAGSSATPTKRTATGSSCMWDKANEPKMPKGTVGHRWAKTKGKWNLKLERRRRRRAHRPAADVPRKRDDGGACSPSSTTSPPDRSRSARRAGALRQTRADGKVRSPRSTTC